MSNNSNNLSASKKAIVIGASSDIGDALCRDWLSKDWEVHGTYRTMSEGVRDLTANLTSMTQCDLSSKSSIDEACKVLGNQAKDWDVLIMGPGLQDPVNLFLDCDIDEWSESIEVNFTNQVRIVHCLLQNRNRPSSTSPVVLFFAGGGTNNATLRYSAYTISKIASIKMMELLAAEIPEVKFVIVGPGWVKTKIHDSTIKAGDKAGDNYLRTIEKLKSEDCTPMKSVIDCCNSLIDGSTEIISGRNFSVVFDKWGTKELNELLEKYPDMYKLRRFGNDF
jgi:NAD(P)-dependent dehydrogenase (short-subunit alcohol dehydrogenase family)